MGAAAALLLVGAALSANLGLGGTASPDRTGGAAGGALGSHETSRTTDRSAPESPPARVCGSPGLRGPTSRPAGYSAVSPSQRLDIVVERASGGTRFWLEEGTHHLGRGKYDQVVPKSGMVFLGAPGAVLDGHRQNLYAFTGQASDVTIEHLTIQNFGATLDNRDEGVVNHDQGDGWRIRHNTVRWNGGAGVFIGDGNTVAHNCLQENGQYGFSAYEPDGVRNVRLHHNEISGNNTADWERRIDGCGCTGGGKFWATTNADVTSNWIHDNRGPGIWADTNNAGFLVSHNYIADNDAEGVFYETSYNAEISANTFVRNGLVKGRGDTGFPTPAVYLSESGGDRRAGREYSTHLRVVGNRFVDNWGGVVGWENADRFAGSPANTSTGTTTLVNPRVATEANCKNPRLIGTDPYVDDCRWKTQNLLVTENYFAFSPERLGAACTAARLCGFSGLMSQYGTYPDWSPYHGTVVEQRVAVEQNNVWAHNRYRGPWRFMARELGNRVSWTTWRGTVYEQDRGSILN